MTFWELHSEDISLIYSEYLIYLILSLFQCSTVTVVCQHISCCHSLYFTLQSVTLRCAHARSSVTCVDRTPTFWIMQTVMQSVTVWISSHVRSTPGVIIWASSSTFGNFSNKNIVRNIFSSTSFYRFSHPCFWFHCFLCACIGADLRKTMGQHRQKLVFADILINAQ